jgi:TRAP-type C4-dicarboxylate transport system substrate-binding protein
MKKYVYLVMCFIVMCACLNGCKKGNGSSNTPAEPAVTTITLTYANFPPASTFPCVQMERWKAEVEKRTNGKVAIKTFPGGTLLEAKDMFDGVVAGQADIGCLCMAYQPGRFSVTNALALPLGIKDAKTGSKMLWELYTKYKPAEFEPVKVLTMFTTAPSNIMSKKPVRTLEDIKGMSLRASGGAGEILQAWGANMVGMPMSATPEALQKGTVQGLFSSIEVMKDFKFAELCKYVTMTDTSVYPFAVVMNKAKFDSLPDDVKKVFEELAVEQMNWTGDYMDNHVTESIAFSKEQYKVEFIELTAEQKADWNKLLEPIVAKWIADNKDKIPAQQIADDLKKIMEQPK